MKILRRLHKCEIINPSESISDAIDNLLSVYVKGYQFTTQFKRRQWDGKVHHYSTRTHKFWSGHLNTVEKFLDSLNIFVDVVDLRDQLYPQKPLTKQLHDIKLRDYQKIAVNALLDKETCILKAATNSGKTAIMAEVIRKLGLSTLIIVHRQLLLHQTAERLQKMLKIPIGKIGDNISEIQKITVVMPQSLIKSYKNKLTGTVTMNIKSEYDELLTYPVLFFDECQNICDKKILWTIKHSQAYYRYAMSGTPLLGDKATNMELIGQFGEVAFEVTNKELISLGVSSVPTCYIVKIEQDTNDLDYQTSYKTDIVENDERNIIIAQLTHSLTKKYNILIVVREIEHGYLLNTIIPTASYVHGNMPTKMRLVGINNFINNKSKILITSTILDEGLDISNIEVIIMAAAGKSPRQMLQRIGRGLRKKKSNKLIWIDFLDCMNEYLLDHSIDRTQVFKNEGFDIKLLNLDKITEV